MTRIKLLLIVALLVGFAVLAHAGYDEGEAAYKRGDYAKAYEEFKPLAEQGQAVAQSNLGSMYELGQGVPQDYVEAAKWTRKAAEQGYSVAQSNLGVMYYYGQGVPQDYGQAMKWYRKAAQQGDAGAQYNLGLMYDKGRGVSQDYVEAAKWYRKAADQGLAEAQSALAVVSPKGMGAQKVEIPLESAGSGVYELPVRINGVITLNFILDSGASEVVIPADVFLTLLRTGSIKDEDILPGERYQLADGSTVKSPRFNIRDLEIGGYKITNVAGSIVDPRGSLLLGQSFLNKFDSWTLDNRAHTLILSGHKSGPAKIAETEKSKASESGLEKLPAAQYPSPSKSLIPPLPDLPSKYAMLVKAMLDGAKNGEVEKIDRSKAELQVSSKGQKCRSKEAQKKNAAGIEANSYEDNDNAVRDFYDAYLLCPNDVEILNNLGWALIRAGDYDNAEKALLRDLSLAPARANPWVNLGQLLSPKLSDSGKLYK